MRRVCQHSQRSLVKVLTAGWVLKSISDAASERRLVFHHIILSSQLGVPSVLPNPFLSSFWIFFFMNNLSCLSKTVKNSNVKWRYIWMSTIHCLVRAVFISLKKTCCIQIEFWTQWSLKNSQTLQAGIGLPQYHIFITWLSSPDKVIISIPMSVEIWKTVLAIKSIFNCIAHDHHD